MLLTRALTAALCLFILSSWEAVAEVRRMPILAEFDFSIRISGEITNSDVNSFSMILRTFDRARHIGLGVFLNSNGGDINAAIEIGRRLRQVRGLAIVNINEECASLHYS